MSATLTHLRTAIANLRRIEREHIITERQGNHGSFTTNPYAESLARAEAEVNAALDALEGIGQHPDDLAVDRKVLLASEGPAGATDPAVLILRLLIAIANKPPLQHGQREAIAAAYAWLELTR